MGEEGTEILRVVVRETLTKDLIERLIYDIVEVTEGLAGKCEFEFERIEPPTSFSCVSSF